MALIASYSTLATTAGGLSSAAARASRSISDFRGSRTVKRGIRGRVAVAVGAGIDGAALGRSNFPDPIRRVFHRHPPGPRHPAPPG